VLDASMQLHVRAALNLDDLGKLHAALAKHIVTKGPVDELLAYVVRHGLDLMEIVAEVPSVCFLMQLAVFATKLLETKSTHIDPELWEMMNAAAACASVLFPTQESEQLLRDQKAWHVRDRKRNEPKAVDVEAIIAAGDVPCEQPKREVCGGMEDAKEEEEEEKVEEVQEHELRQCAREREEDAREREEEEEKAAVVHDPDERKLPFYALPFDASVADLRKTPKANRKQSIPAVLFCSLFFLYWAPTPVPDARDAHPRRGLDRIDRCVVERTALLCLACACAPAGTVPDVSDAHQRRGLDRDALHGRLCPLLCTLSSN